MRIDLTTNFLGNENNLGSIVPASSYLDEYSEEKMKNLISQFLSEWEERFRGIYIGKTRYVKFVEWLVMTGAFHMYSKVLEVKTEWPIIKIHLD